MYFGFWSEMRSMNENCSLLYIFFTSQESHQNTFFFVHHSLVFSHLNVCGLQYLMCIDITWQLFSFANKMRKASTRSAAANSCPCGPNNLALILHFTLGFNRLQTACVVYVNWVNVGALREDESWLDAQTRCVNLIGCWVLDQKCSWFSRSSCETGTSPHALLPVCLS